MNKVFMSTQFNGEAFEIWETNQTDLEKAWEEIDQDIRPTQGGQIYMMYYQPKPEGQEDWEHSFYEAGEERMVVNGGYANN